MGKGGSKKVSVRILTKNSSHSNIISAKNKCFITRNPVWHIPATDTGIALPVMTAVTTLAENYKKLHLYVTLSYIKYHLLSQTDYLRKYDVSS